MTHQSHVEIERKYDVDDDIAAPGLVGAGPVATQSLPETVELVAVYFDTEALDLARNRIAVRVRRGGGDAGWHVKLPADEGRTELQWPLTDDDDDDDDDDHDDDRQPPPAVLEALREFISDAPLAPLARVTNRRTTIILKDAAGFDIAEFCDDHVRSEQLRAGSSADRSWREWEVELLRAAPDTRGKRTALLDDLERRLLEAGARVSSSSSKLARALGADELGT